MSNARLVQTSQGQLEIALLKLPAARFAVAVRAFGEDGWEVGEKQQWFGKGSESLAQFLVSSVHLGETEAGELAGQIREQWWEEYLDAGDHRADFGTAKRQALVVLVGIALLVGLALLGVALLVWLLVT